MVAGTLSSPRISEILWRKKLLARRRRCSIVRTEHTNADVEHMAATTDTTKTTKTQENLLPTNVATTTSKTQHRPQHNTKSKHNSEPDSTERNGTEQNRTKRTNRPRDSLGLCVIPSHPIPSHPNYSLLSPFCDILLQFLMAQSATWSASQGSGQSREPTFQCRRHTHPPTAANRLSHRPIPD